MDSSSPSKGDHDVVIVGCGPVGSYAGYRLAREGLDVLLIDKRSEIGRPVQCAGIVNSSMMELKGLDALSEDIILKKIEGADIYAPSGELLPLRGHEPKACSIDRHGLDIGLFRMAVSNGAQAMIRSRVTSSGKTPGGRAWVSGIKDGDPFKASGDIVIGADGPGSIIRKDTKIAQPRETIPGMNMELEIKDVEVPSKKVAVLTGTRTAKGFFSWVIPTYDRNGVRIGLSSTSGKDLRMGIENIMKDVRLAQFLGTDLSGLNGIQPLSFSFGAVPMGSPRSLIDGPFVLLGDSAGMAKGTSGGGIYPGLRSVDLLSDISSKNGNLDESVLLKFNSSWNRGYGRELARTHILRKIMRDLTDEEMNRAISEFNDDRKLELINREGDIDRPIRLAAKLLKMDPALLKLVPRFFPLLAKLI